MDFFCSLLEFVIHDTTLFNGLFGEYKHFTCVAANISPPFYHKKSHKTIRATTLAKDIVIDDMDGAYDFEVSITLSYAISILKRHLLYYQFSYHVIALTFNDLNSVYCNGFYNPQQKVGKPRYAEFNRKYRRN